MASYVPDLHVAPKVANQSSLLVRAIVCVTFCFSLANVLRIVTGIRCFEVSRLLVVCLNRVLPTPLYQKSSIISVKNPTGNAF